jgi:hypothetical protein
LDLKALPGIMGVRVASLVKNINEAKKSCARAVLSEVVRDTPVDTGEARSNWQVSVGGDITSIVPPYVPYPKFSHGNGQGTAETANAAAAISVGDANIDSTQPGQDIFISNNVDHIGLLNEGSSRQAPAAFVQSGVVAGLNAVRAARVVD